MLVIIHENIPAFLQQVASLNWLVKMYAAFLLSVVIQGMCIS